MDTKLLTELSTSKLMLRPDALLLLEQSLNADEKPADNASQKNSDRSGLAAYIKGGGVVFPEDIMYGNAESVEEGSVLIVPIIGVMRKYDSWYEYGVDFYAQSISEAQANERISGVVLLFNTPGGTTQSLIQIENVLAAKTKPCIAVIDGMCCSCGIHVAAMCDKIYAESRMCEVGSIGVYAQLLDDRKADEKWGYKLIEVYPPESSYKNKGVREAIEGNPQYLIDETLSPYARSFQEHIRKCRKNLDKSVEGILEGRVFYAYDAVENGLIDGIRTTSDVIAELRNRNTINSLFNH
jgi:protease-4